MRARRTQPVGPTRSARLPAALKWFEERLAIHADRSASDLLVQLIHGGLRLRDGYMAIHRNALERHIVHKDLKTYGAYRACLLDTFGLEYVLHLERWLVAEGFNVPLEESSQ